MIYPPHGFEKDPRAMDQIVETLAMLRPDIVYVGLGFPKQERVIAHLRERFPQTWFLGIGMSIGFVGGQVPRAPVWMQRMGLEWLHRLAQEPRRLGRRYLLRGLPFAARLLMHGVLSRMGRETTGEAPALVPYNPRASEQGQTQTGVSSRIRPRGSAPAGR
jgi:N-acetylglucosaminyldiphosphoundecaprenol N-acetyl-beta-D-mannosaminyltransferase